MKKVILTLQIAAIFIGSIVGAGVCSGRELNQFFASYGKAGFWGLIMCGGLYILFGKMIIHITSIGGVKSYNEFVSLVCPKFVARFINGVLTLFLLSSTSIILAGSGALINQHFGLSKGIGFIGMIAISSLFLLKNTKGLFEVNSIVVPVLIFMMSAVFFSYMTKYPNQFDYGYLLMIPRQKSHLALSAIVYVSFNILTIIGVLVPLTAELKKPKDLVNGIIAGSVVLTIISVYITFLMLVNPFHPKMYEMPLLAIAAGLSPWLQTGILGIMWLEMFSSQVSNIYSLSHFMENKFKIKYNTAIFLTVALAAPFSIIGFTRLVEFLYPLYGVLSLVFLMYCMMFYIKSKGKAPRRDIKNPQPYEIRKPNFLLARPTFMFRKK